MSTIRDRRQLAGTTALALLLSAAAIATAPASYAGIGTETTASTAGVVLAQADTTTATTGTQPALETVAEEPEASEAEGTGDAPEQPAAAETAPAEAAPAAAETVAPAQPEADETEAAETAPAAPADEPAAAEATPAPTEEPAEAEAEPAEAEEPAAAEAAAPPVTVEIVADTAPAVAVVPPTDPKLLAVFEMLEKHCARCHQDGKLANRLRPAKNFGDVLDLERLARDPNLIQPGNPDASRLYKQIVKKEMPYDTYYEFSGAEPTVEEVTALRDWIEGLGETQSASCEKRKFMTNEDVVGAIAADLQAEADHRVKGMRYFTLVNLANACASDEELEVYRQGLIKLLNSLSKNPDVVRLATIDEGKTIVKVNLDDLAWTGEDWEKLLSVYPYAAEPDVKLFDFVKQATDTNLAYIRADWMAFAASRPPLYHTILKLPTTYDGLQKEVKLDIKANLTKFLAKRSGFQISGVSRNNRLIERHGIETGAFWTSYDFAGNKGTQSLFEHPLGPEGEGAFTHDGGETIFSLPNGFSAYYLYTADGKQLDTGPTSIVQDTTQKDLLVTNGISCMGCHDQGFRKAKDEIRGHVENDRTFAKEARDAVTALYPTTDEMDLIIDNDVKSFRAAMEKAGLNPDLKYGGIEIINALSKQYEKDVTLRLAAAEFGLSGEEFVTRLEGAGGESFRVKRRLEQGVIPRDTFEVGFKDLLGKVTDDKFAESKGVATAEAAKVADVKEKADVSRDFEISVISDKSVYKKGELATFTIASKQDCNLTLINVDGKGVGTVLLPNDFEKEHFLKAGSEIQVPGPDAAYQLRLQDKGKETVIAVCNASKDEVDGIKHNFDEKQFTELGVYRSFAVRAIKVEKTKKKAGEKKASEEAAETGKVTAKGDVLARTAIKFEVK